MSTPLSRVREHRRHAAALLRAVARAIERAPDDRSAEILIHFQPLLAQLDRQAQLVLPRADFDNDTTLEAMLPPVVVLPSPDVASELSADDVFDLALALLREAAMTISVAACMHDGPGDMRLNREQAICAAMLVRIAKLCNGLLIVVEAGGARDLAFILNRCIFETAIHARYLMRHLQDDALFERFVDSGLDVERELHDLIMENVIERRGERLPIEDRMLATMERLATDSGRRLDALPRARRWGPDLRQQIEDVTPSGVSLGLYVGSQRMPSHATHGTWVDLLTNHLDRHSDGFSVSCSWSTTDTRLVLPIALSALEATMQYSLTFFTWEAAELQQLMDRLSDLRYRIVDVDLLDEWLRQQPDEERP